MLYRVHWIVNDGRNGYPNIVSDLNWSEVESKSYDEAIKKHSQNKDISNLLSVKQISKGVMRDLKYRDYLVTYNSKDENGFVEKEIRVFKI